MTQSRVLRVALVLVAVASAATMFVARSQHAAAASATRGLSHAGDSLEAMVAEQLALETFADTKNVALAESAIAAAHRDFDAAVTAVRALPTNPAERRMLTSETTAEDRWQAVWFGLVSRHQAHGAALDLRPARVLLGSVTRAEKRLTALQLAAAADAQGQADSISALLLIATLLVLAGLIGAGVFRDRSVRRGHGFNELLSASRTEDEAYGLLKRHLERTVRRAAATVLVRNNSANHLEARTPAPSAAVAERLQSATPDSCLAVRLARPHARRRGGDELLRCEVCGAVQSAALCSPLLVGGEVMGAVLLTREPRFTEATNARVAEVLLLAAPAIANLRHLAIAEARAATDALTGLSNRRTIDDEVKRMAATAARTGSPLAAAMLDIDHFKRVNDTYGHERGDELLAAVAGSLSAAVRGGDFVGRYGGEEFLILLPDTGREGAAAVAEKIRATIADLRLNGMGSSVTVSLGVAVMPDDAHDSEQLVRMADRALYLAKSLGRNQVTLAAATNEKSLVD